MLEDSPTDNFSPFVRNWIFNVPTRGILALVMENAEVILLCCSRYFRPATPQDALLFAGLVATIQMLPQVSHALWGGKSLGLFAVDQGFNMLSILIKVLCIQYVPYWSSGHSDSFVGMVCWMMLLAVATVFASVTAKIQSVLAVCMWSSTASCYFTWIISVVIFVSVVSTAFRKCFCGKTLKITFQHYRLYRSDIEFSVVWKVCSALSCCSWTSHSIVCGLTVDPLRP